MLPTFVIALREGVEAALIVGIILAVVLALSYILSARLVVTLTGPIASLRSA